MHPTPYTDLPDYVVKRLMPTSDGELSEVVFKRGSRYQIIRDNNAANFVYCQGSWYCIYLGKLYVQLGFFNQNYSGYLKKRCVVARPMKNDSLLMDLLAQISTRPL